MKEQAFTVSLRRVQGRNCSTADSSDTLQGIVDLRIGGRLLIKDSVLTLLHGHSYALIGNNGCGKSTLLSALCHLFPTQMFLLEQQDVNNALNQSTETVLEYVCNNDHVGSSSELVLNNFFFSPSPHPPIPAVTKMPKAIEDD